MEVFKSLLQWQSRNAQRMSDDETLGFAPTMGCLHDGHGALVARAVEENDRALVSIFINPTQFDDPQDLQNYPIQLKEDLEKLEEWGCDFVILPTKEEIYADGYRYKITEDRDSSILCGAHRPGHFTGVLTVVMKLLNLAEADHAYFGEKDFQQLHLIEGMVQAFFMKTKIIACATVREPDGLAMSSRNKRLSEAERVTARQWAQLLHHSGTDAAVQASLEAAGLDVDYVESHWGRRFGAVRVGNVRLIDNYALSESQDGGGLS